MSESFSGIVTIAAAPEDTPVITLNGGTGDVAIGTSNRSGDSSCSTRAEVRAS